MDRQAVQSSNVASVGYDAETQTLEVEFKGGAVYHYAGVPAGVYVELLGAASVGGYLARAVKGVYPASRV